MFIVVCALHLWKLGSAPKGFYVDEASIAYNAYCIGQTGADEYGTHWPVFFRCFDTYTDAVDVYSAVLPIRFLGLNQLTAHLPSALFDLMACVAFFILLRQWRVGEWLALAGAVAFSVVPWVFPLSRNGAFAGHTAALMGLVLGLVLTDAALRRRSNGLAILAGVAWALAFYAHQSIRPVLALLAAGSAVVLWRSLVRRWRVVLVMLGSAFAVLLPMIISVARFPQALTARFNQVGLSSETGSVWNMVTGVASRYADYFGPRFLFISGDDELRHHTGHGGELYWCLVPLILAGLYVAIRYWRSQPRYRVVLIGLLVSPVAAALTIDRMHSTRGVYAVVFWLTLAVIGARALWHHKRLGRKLLVVICAAGLIECGAYLADYFGPYQARCRKTFQTAFTEALTYCFNHVHGNQVLYVSGSVGTTCSTSVDPDFKPFVYMYLLYYGRIDPWTYQHGGFSNTIIRPYLERIDRPGLLLRCNYTPDRLQTPFKALPNDESIPTNAILAAMFSERPLDYEVYEVRR